MSGSVKKVTPSGPSEILPRAGSAGAYQLRTEILRRVNLIAAPAKVDAVLIEEMLIN